MGRRFSGLNNILRGIALAAILISCGGEELTEGEIIGISAQIPLSEAQSERGIENMAYMGTLSVRLPDGTEVEAACDEELIAAVEGSPTMNKTEAEMSDLGGFIASVTVKLEAGQGVMMVADSLDGWRVVEILQE